MFRTMKRHLATITILMLAPGAALAFDAAGWTGEGSFGTLGANGVVTLAPGGGAQYGWISTNGGVNSSPFDLNLGAETNGSYMRSGLFYSAADQVLDFQFNFVTSDGAGYADYAWARLLDASNAPVATLYTARVNPDGTTVPGFGMSPPVATITPPSATVVPGGPQWSPLGGSSKTCYNKGCGYTGWVDAKYTIGSAGTYQLEFGVVNWSDTAYATGMAFDGITVGGQPIGAPEPSSFVVAAAGLALLWVASRRKDQKGIGIA